MSVKYGGDFDMSFRVEDHHRQLAAAVDRLTLAMDNLAESAERDSAEAGAVEIVGEVCDFLEILRDELRSALRGGRRFVQVLPGLSGRVLGELQDLDDADRQLYLEAYTNAAVASFIEAGCDREALEANRDDYARLCDQDAALNAGRQAGPLMGLQPQQIERLKRVLAGVPAAELDKVVNKTLRAACEGYTKSDLKEQASGRVRARLAELEQERDRVPVAAGN